MLPTIHADLLTFRAVFADFITAVPPDAWDQRTGTREKDWTLHQTLAHLVSIAELFNQAVDAAVHDAPLNDLNQREDLTDWNEAQIEAREEATPGDLAAQMLAALDGAAERAQRLTPTEAEQPIFLRVYNRPARAIDCLDWQLSHAGVLHAAQVAFPLEDTPPLWTHYDDDLLCRQVDRFLRQFSYAYWPLEDMHAALNFHIEGCGTWHIIAAPDGGAVGSDAAEDAAYALRFASPAVLFGVFTVHLPLMEAIGSGAITITGQPREALMLLRRFRPTPP